MYYPFPLQSTDHFPLALPIVSIPAAPTLCPHIYLLIGVLHRPGIHLNSRPLLATFVSTWSCIGHAPLTASICVNAFQWTQVHSPSDSILCYPWKTETRLIWKDLGSFLCWVQAWVPLCIWIKVKWGRVAFLSPYFKARLKSRWSSSEDQLPGSPSNTRSPAFVFRSKHLSQFSWAVYLKGRVTAWWIRVVCHYVSLTFIVFILEPGFSFAWKKKILETNHSYKTMPFSNECICSFGNRGEWLGLST